MAGTSGGQHAPRRRLPTPEEVDRLHEEGREHRREEARRMTPLERMEEAYRLSKFMRWES